MVDRKPTRLMIRDTWEETRESASTTTIAVLTASSNSRSDWLCDASPSVFKHLIRSYRLEFFFRLSEMVSCRGVCLDESSWCDAGGSLPSQTSCDNEYTVLASIGGESIEDDDSDHLQRNKHETGGHISYIQHKPLWQNPLEQWGHANGFSLLWNLWWVTRSEWRMYPLPHWGHRWGSVPLCMWRWRARSHLWMKDFEQISHLNLWSSCLSQACQLHVNTLQCTEN